MKTRLKNKYNLGTHEDIPTSYMDGSNEFHLEMTDDQSHHQIRFGHFSHLVYLVVYELI